MSLKRKISKVDKYEPPNKVQAEQKDDQLVNEVLKQGRLGNLVVILHNEEENPYVSLQNALAHMNMVLEVIRDPTNQQNFELKIDGQQYATGTFQNIALAKKSLAGEALDKLRETCFFIHLKKNFVNVTKQNLQLPSSSTNSAVSSGSIAHKIMMKMGWAGGGLGAQEQGSPDSVVLTENVNRQGFGSNNLMAEITKKIAEFSSSSNLLTLVFDADFSKGERMMIHKVARRYNLKSKSSGTEARKLMISRKITRMDIVRELLKLGGEDGLYELHIPKRFA